MVQFVGLLDAQGTVLEINQVALDAVGISLADVEGKPFWTTFWWQVSEEINATLRQSIARAAQGEFVRWDTPIYGRAGGKETIIIDASLSPVQDDEGNVVYICAEGRDITEKKAHEREIARQREELAQLDVLKTQFFANISHEFRTPLTLMLGPIEDAITDPTLAAQPREHLEVAHRNSLRLLKLVNSLLDFSRLEAGRMQAAYEPTDLSAFTAELASVFRSAIEREGMALTVDCPPLAQPAYVDRDMWEKVVLNLLSNAFKFTFDGKIAVTLREQPVLGASKAEGSVELEVLDTGIGIPAHELPRLFERFHRIEGARGRTYEGTGIGLALVQELAKLHGGTVRVESVEGQGSTFTVAMPLGKGHLPPDRVEAARTMPSTALKAETYVQEALRWIQDPQHPAESAPEVGGAPPIAPDGRRGRVLLADDNADMREYVHRLLNAWYEVETVADGQAALEAIRRSPPDLVLADVMMPRMDGFALLRALRSDPHTQTLPVILLSARAGEESRVEGLDAGADDYLIKPFSARELVSRVGVQHGRKRLQDVQKQAEAVHAQLAAIVDASEDAIIGQTLEGVITSWNQGAERLYGYTAAEALGQPITLLSTPDWPDEMPQLLVRLQCGERVDLYETQRVRKDGTRLDVSLTLSLIRDSTGRVVSAATIARDITTQKQAEAELERRRQETALLAEIAQHLSASLDLDTVLQRVVTGAQTLCGSERVFLALRASGTDTFVGRYEIGAPQRAYANLEIALGQGLGGQVLRTGRPWCTRDYATDPRFSKEFLARARAKGHLAVLAVPILIAARVEGLLYASNLASQPFTDRDEEILVRLAAHAALAIQNAQLYQQAQAELAERRTAEAALARAAAELEQRVAERTAELHQAMAERQRLEQEAQRVEHFALLGRLAAGVSHEIRNPLGTVFLHVDLLAEELGEHAPESAALVADTLAEIRMQLVRLDDLVQDYLSLVRTAQNELTPQDLGAVLREWATEWRVMATTHGMAFQLDGLDDLGVVAVHASTLRRALLNLVQNALDAMPQGGTLTLQGHQTDTIVQLDVCDTGSGISPEQRARIFEPLYTTKAGGTGLGLYIVQEVVAAHGGQVAAQSVAGQGSTFTITLPLMESRVTY
jgi:PAS domain S-box-containing protein